MHSYINLPLLGWHIHSKILKLIKEQRPTSHSPPVWILKPIFFRIYLCSCPCSNIPFPIPMSVAIPSDFVTLALKFVPLAIVFFQTQLWFLLILTQSRLKLVVTIQVSNYEYSPLFTSILLAKFHHDLLMEFNFDWQAVSFYLFLAVRYFQGHLELGMNLTESSKICPRSWLIIH